MTCAIFARFAASLSRFTFCAGVSFLGAGSAKGRVVARPGFVCAHTPVAVNRVESLVYFDGILGVIGRMGRCGTANGGEEMS